MTAIEQKIEELGSWAAGLELSAADPSTPYWMRLSDAKAAESIRQQQFGLIEQARRCPEPLAKCAVDGCENRVAGQRYCFRCDEEINAQPYPLRSLLLGETFIQRVNRLWDRLTAA